MNLTNFLNNLQKAVSEMQGFSKALNEEPGEEVIITYMLDGKFGKLRPTQIKVSYDAETKRKYYHIITNSDTL